MNIHVRPIECPTLGASCRAATVTIPKSLDSSKLVARRKSELFGVEGKEAANPRDIYDRDYSSK
jgi:hypothetical protein